MQGQQALHPIPEGNGASRPRRRAGYLPAYHALCRLPCGAAGTPHPAAVCRDHPGSPWRPADPPRAGLPARGPRSHGVATRLATSSAPKSRHDTDLPRQVRPPSAGVPVRACSPGVPTAHPPNLLRRALPPRSPGRVCCADRIKGLLAFDGRGLLTASPAQIGSKACWPLMAVDFAVIRPLVRPAQPRIRFSSTRSRVCATLPADPASRRRPCASLTLHRHQAG